MEWFWLVVLTVVIAAEMLAIQWLAGKVRDRWRKMRAEWAQWREQAEAMLARLREKE